MSEMDELNEAATLIREQWPTCACDDEACGPAYELEAVFHRAVADWLDDCGHLVEYGDIGPVHKRHALAVARAYLGRTP